MKSARSFPSWTMAVFSTASVLFFSLLLSAAETSRPDGAERLLKVLRPFSQADEASGWAITDCSTRLLGESATEGLDGPAPPRRSGAGGAGATSGFEPNSRRFGASTADGAAGLDLRLLCTLGKIVGLFGVQCTFPNGRVVHQEVIVMENLLYNRKVSRMYDLKGSVRNRYLEVAGEQESQDRKSVV